MRAKYSIYFGKKLAALFYLKRIKPVFELFKKNKDINSRLHILRCLTSLKEMDIEIAFTYF